MRPLLRCGGDEPVHEVARRIGERAGSYALVRLAEPSTFVSPAALDTLTRRHLRETFRAIRHVQIRADQDWIRRLTHDR